MINIAPFPIMSVVIPMYNVEKYIRQCLNSVIDQTFRQIEILCVDDGCTDRTLEIVKSFNDNRIRIVSQSNRGLSAARNTGINASRGLYVALLDADDYWAPGKLMHHYVHLSRDSSLGVSYSASTFVDEEGETMTIGQHPKLENISAEHILCRNPVGNGSAAVIRSSLLRELGIVTWVNGERRRCYFDENLRQSEDIEFWLRVALSSEWKFRGIGEALTYYRVNEGGLSANTDKQLAAWERGINKHRDANPDFFKRNYPLARAYQFRYLARRAVRAGQSRQALTLLRKAFQSDWRILLQEPKRTLLTCGCALLSALPNKVYRSLENMAMREFGKTS